MLQLNQRVTLKGSRVRGEVLGIINGDGLSYFVQYPDGNGGFSRHHFKPDQLVADNDWIDKALMVIKFAMFVSLCIWMLIVAKKTTQLEADVEYLRMRVNATAD